MLDALSRKAVGWAITAHMHATIQAIQAFQRALAERRPPRGTIHHSDQSTQYACEKYRVLLERQCLQASTRGRSGSSTAPGAAC
ncbi:MAG: hypothetical protein J0J01_16345 [Reyranella sp.]|nr:hypothetical protein [Reyranella sp.]